jgi:hypothetical protein
MPEVLKQNKENPLYIHFPDMWIKQVELVINTSESVNEVETMSVLKIWMKSHSGFGFYMIISYIIEVCHLQYFVLILKQNDTLCYYSFVF